MAPDIVFWNPGNSVVVCECKLDSHFTFNDWPPEGQVSRYISYLTSLGVKSAFLLITPKFNESWYSERVAAAVNYGAKERNEHGSAYVVIWEDICAATGANHSFQPTAYSGG